LENVREGPCLDLYEYDAKAQAGNHLALLSTGIGAGDVRGVLGASRDGEYVYFIRFIGRPESGLNSGTWGIYLAHGGRVSFISRIEGGYSCCDQFQPQFNFDRVPATYRVTSNGQLLYTTVSPQTEYDPRSVTDSCFLGDSNGLLDPAHGDGCDEVYIYDTGVGHIVCESCDPTNAAPRQNATFTEVVQGAFGQNVPGAISRSVTDDGSMVFFDSPDALVPQDTNGRLDAYEWEKNGVGSCGLEEGCVRLISSGQCDCDSAFLEATPDGHDVFFTTTQKLVRLDSDYLRDVYDARIEGGIASQNELPAPQCQGESCQSAVIPPNDATPSSATYAGPGNPPLALTKATPKRAKSKQKACRKGLVRKHGKCVKNKRGKRAGTHAPVGKRSTRRHG
jgi:hypothetical protein